MLDLHCHILPATNDGPQTIEESLQMARLAREDGITNIMATQSHDRFLRPTREWKMSN